MIFDSIQSPNPERAHTIVEIPDAHFSESPPLSERVWGVVSSSLDVSAKLLGYGALACNVSKKIGLSKIVPGIDLVDPAKLTAMSNTTGIFAINSSPKEITEEKAINYATKMTQLMTFGLRSMGAKAVADSLESVPSLFGTIGTVIAVYKYVWIPIQETVKEANSTCSIALGV